MTFALLLRKAKPDSGIAGKGEGEGARDAATAVEGVEQQLGGLRALSGLHRGLLWAALGFS